MSASDTGSRLTAAVSATRGEGLADAGVDVIRAKDPVTIVIFGASGDLAKRKLIPALYHLQAGGYLPERYAVVGFSRTPMSDEAYRESMLDGAPRAGEEATRRSRPTTRSSRRSTTSAGDADKPAIVPGAEGAARGDRARARPARQPALLPLGRAGVLPAHRREPRGRRPDPPHERHRPGRASSSRSPSATISRAPARSTPSSATTPRREPDLPHRSLPRERDGPEHPELPLRQLDLRAALQPEVRRQRADHRRRDARHGRPPRRLLRHRRHACATWCRTTCCSSSA